MIVNLPDEIGLSDIQKFDFGSIEANDDHLLLDSVCKTASMDEFLNGRKNIVLGEKGTGKTALFRLLKEDKLKFKLNDNQEIILIPIDDNFLYKNVKGKILKLIRSDSDEDNFKYQIVWELFLFYKCLEKIRELNLDVSPTLQRAISLTDQVFSKGGIDVFLKTKKTVGLRLYETSALLLPELYYTVEPSELGTQDMRELSVEQLELDLDLYKRELNSFLEKRNKKITILIDRLDEFVSHHSVKIQIDMLEALISVEREYMGLECLELKIFLRHDLFQQLSFDGIGYDKVISKKVDLNWSAVKIREFVARRMHKCF